MIRPIEWVTAERNGEQVTALVVYSMGNFVSNISRSHEGVDIVHSVSNGRYLHDVFPCLADMTGINGVDSMINKILRAVEHARELCEIVVGSVTVD